MSHVSGFKPSTNAPLFPNGSPSWPAGLELRLTIAGIDIDIDTTTMGLCGGMAFITRDIFESHTPQLRNCHCQDLPLPVAEHILSRLLDSFAGPGVVGRWQTCTSELDHSTWLRGEGLFAQTVAEAHKVMACIDQGVLCPIGVVLVQSMWPWEMFGNHVELVYGYDLAGSMLTLHTYDCNNPGNDDIKISLDIGSTEPAKPVSTTGTSIKGSPGRVRGFFVLPYEHADTAPLYVDDGEVRITTPPVSPLTCGTRASVQISVHNTGTTSWPANSTYRVGTQDPQDNVVWGRNRVALPTMVDPECSADFRFDVTAPTRAAQAPLQLRMVREGVHWFGSASGVVTVAVGATGGSCAALHAEHAQLVAQLDQLQAELDDLAQLQTLAPVGAGADAAILDGGRLPGPVRPDPRRILLLRQIAQVKKQIAAVEQQQVTTGCAPV